MPHNGISTYRNAFQVSKTTCCAANAAERMGKSCAVKNGFRNSETDKTLYRDGTAAARKTSPSGARPPLPPTGKSTPVHLRIHSALPCSFTRFPTVVHIVHRVIHNLRPLCRLHRCKKPTAVHIICLQGARPPTRPSAATRQTKSHDSAATSLLTASATSRNPPWKSGETVTVPRSVRTRTRPSSTPCFSASAAMRALFRYLVVVDRFRLNKEAGQQCGDIIRRDVERLERSKKLEYSVGPSSSHGRRPAAPVVFPLRPHHKARRCSLGHFNKSRSAAGQASAELEGGTGSAPAQRAGRFRRGARRTETRFRAMRRRCARRRRRKTAFRPRLDRGCACGAGAQFSGT